MIRWLRSLFAWRTVRNAGAWSYLENEVSGQRQACRIYRGYSPIDFGWLDAGIGEPKIDGKAAWRTSEGLSHYAYRSL